MRFYEHDSRSHRTNRSKGSECIQIARGRRNSKAMTRLLCFTRSCCNDNRVVSRRIGIARFCSGLGKVKVPVPGHGPDSEHAYCSGP